MSQGTEIIEHSSRRVLLYLAGSAVLLLGTWLAFRRGAGDPQPPPPSAPELEFLGGVQPAAIDPVRAADNDDDRGGPRLAAPTLPRIDPVPEHELSPERRAALADPGPVTYIDSSARAALDAARAAATIELQDTLDRRRSALQRACGGKGNHKSATLFVQASFGADGKLIAQSVDDHGKTPEIRDCVQAQPLPITIPPTGVEMSVRATLSLP